MLDCMHLDYGVLFITGIFSALLRIFCGRKHFTFQDCQMKPWELSGDLQASNLEMSNSPSHISILRKHPMSASVL